MRLGNDIVDLKATAGHHPRFIDRILNPEEKARRASWSLDEPLLWLHWACKEAAYKAIRQSREIPFHHRDFIVAPDLKTIRYQADLLHIHSEQDADAVFALVTDGDLLSCFTRFGSFPAEPEPQLASERARAMLLDLAAEKLQLPRASLTISPQNRIPRILHEGHRVPGPASLTHHGRYVAASLAIP